MFCLATLLCLGACSSSSSSGEEANSASKEPVDHEAVLAKMRAAFDRQAPAPEDKAWVKRKLAHMAEMDQYVRRHGLNYFWNEVDSENTHDLQLLLKRYDWFTISQFGEEADHDAWLIVQHSPDARFQERVLRLLEPLVARGESDRKRFGYLQDRVHALLWGTSQRYGTQGTCSDSGEWQPLPLEDPERVDEYRRSIGLEPLASYKEKMDAICAEDDSGAP